MKFLPLFLLASGCSSLAERVEVGQAVLAEVLKVEYIGEAQGRVGLSPRYVAFEGTARGTLHVTTPSGKFEIPVEAVGRRAYRIVLVQDGELDPALVEVPWAEAAASFPRLGD